IMASFKIWRNINGGSNSVYWVSPGGTLISQGNYIYELQGIGTSSTGGELSHNYYGFSIFLNAWPSGDLITSLLYSQNSNLNDQKFETANEDQVTTLPDLVVQNISVSSIQVQAGETISASCTVRNIGVGGATSSRVGYYLASNCNSAMQYLGDDAVSSLDPNQSSNENETLIIPANTSPGVYYLVFVADYENSVLESDENNNKACGDAFFNVVSPTPAITVNPTSVNFGNVNIGQNSDQTVTITNGPNSNGNLSGNISVSGNGFSIVSGGGQYDLSPGQTHQIVVRFTPTQSGSHNGTLSISHNAGNQSSPITVPLTGNGVETINITVSPTPINFGNVILGRYKEESVIITNGSNSTGNLIGNISVNGNGITLVSGGGNYNLAFGQSHSTTVRFSPTDSGQHSGILTVTHNAGNHPNPFPVSLSGNGETPTLYINPSSIQVAATAGSVNFNVNSNETWSIGVSCDWVTASSMADSGNKVITVNYFANSNSLPRECQIIIGLDHSIMVEHFML
ncbi:MAG: choice-of-anchor D domain-containing protein, partial [Ignavibacteriaceae bacterium]|nr:choice-of-anchor D domain-containing protein [Ignavibacteriaceae bacterium]